MFYYQTFVNDLSYKGMRPLTYATSRELPVGQLVIVPLKHQFINGFIVGETRKPNFATKPIKQVLEMQPLPPQVVALATWIPAYYPSPLGGVGQLFIPKGLSNKHHYASEQSLDASKYMVSLPPLTPEQQKVLQQISNPNTYLLHGETGSGKTRIYIELAGRAINAGKSAIVCTPEIGLTPQLATDFEQTFGKDRVIVTHSQLTEKARREAWLTILHANEPKIVIGPRSALFSPLKNVGLIVLDEFHEPTYKQEQSPHYHAGKVAAQLAALHGAVLVLGSATPSIVDYYTAIAKKKSILRMRHLARGETEKSNSIKIIDLKDRTQFTRTPHVSDELLAAIEKALNSQEQSLLFLNRRGTARIVLCEQCGWQAACSHCNLPLSYHGDSHVLRCHICGITQPALTSCPVCKKPNIVLKSIGTKAVVDELTKIFPHARIQRFDTDNAKLERLERHYQSIRTGDVDILVGTQILAKGLDLPKLRVVGIVIAETGLYLPDYTAQERTYQLLRQVVGRVGRGHRDSTVVVQTYDPENFVLNTALTNDWPAFYEQELSERQKFLFPPYCFLLKLTCRRATVISAQRAANQLAHTLQAKKLRIIIEGPTPSLHEKIGSKYQWQLIIKAKDRAELIKTIASLPSGWSYDIDPLNLL